MSRKKKISVLHVTYNDVSGGAARYASRVHSSLIKHGVDSKMLVLNKESDNPTVHACESGRIRKQFSSAIDKLPLVFYKNQNSKISPGLFNDFVTSQIEKMNPDIVHLHWTNNGLMSIRSISRIKQPIIWSILDMWPFTGGCHYDDWCYRYTENCGKCPVLNSNRKNDLSRYILNIKKSVYAKIDFSTIAISQWMKDCMIKSTVMKDKEVKVIPPSLDLTLFRPIEKKISRDLFNLPKNKKLILFGAINSTSDPRKGFHQLIEALKKINDEDSLKNIEIVVFGATNSDFESEIKLKVNFVGRLTSGYGSFDDASLSALYSAADLTIVPSLQEAFGQVAIESMACGVPVVAFDKTGLKDIVTHKKDGYLAEHNNIEDLYRGVIWGLKHGGKQEITQNALEKTKALFDESKTALEIIELYKSKINK